MLAIVAFNYTTGMLDATITALAASALPESITDTSDDSVWWGEKATGLLGTYGDPQTFAAMYGYVTEDSPVPKYGGYGAGSSIETAYGGSITGANGCLGGFTFSYPTFPVGLANDTATTATGSGITGATSCAQEFSSTHGEQQLWWTLP